MRGGEDKILSIKLLNTFLFVSLQGDNKYVLHIFTGSKFTAGTDANVLITLYGEKGESGEIKLDNTEDNFERNK